MTIKEFIDCEGTSHEGVLRALWLAHRGEWDQAHALAQAEDSRDGAWVHAYLHRSQGDASNADYWYGRAGRPAYKGGSKVEWETIVAELLQRSR